MIEVKQTEVFSKWLRTLKDSRIKGAITSRIFRLSNGLPGDVKPVGSGLSELRIHLGPGYRVYFKQYGNDIVLLLCAGDKRTQQRDIEKAKKLADSWSK